MRKLLVAFAVCLGLAAVGTSVFGTGAIHNAIARPATESPT
jgi:hypothetical protein